MASFVLTLQLYKIHSQAFLIHYVHSWEIPLIEKMTMNFGNNKRVCALVRTSIIILKTSKFVSEYYSYGSVAKHRRCASKLISRKEQQGGKKLAWTEETVINLTAASKINATRNRLVKSDSYFWGYIFLKRKSHFTLWTIIWISVDCIIWCKSLTDAKKYANGNTERCHLKTKGRNANVNT
jgi:hypothetical protein